MSDQRSITDNEQYRNVAVKLPVLPSALAIQNIAGTLCQVDDEGNVTPLIGGTIGGITSLSGDVVATGPGAVSATIQPGRVTYAKIQNVAANSFLGNSTGAPASVTEISPASARTLLGLAAIATTGSAADLTGILPAASFPALTGDVTTVAGALAATVNIPTSLIPFGSGAGHMTTDSRFGIFSNQVVLGSTNPAAAMAAPWFTSSGYTFVQETAGAGMLLAVSRASNVPGNWNTQKSRGTHASPTVILAGDAIASFSSYGYDGTNFVNSVSLVSLVPSDATIAANSVPQLMGFQWNSGTNTAFDIAKYSLAGDAFGNAYTGSSQMVINSSNGGFLYQPGIAGATSTAPLQVFGSTRAGNRVPTYIDTTDARFYAYIGGAWHFAAINDGATGGISELTGDIAAGPGSGIVASTINNNVVTLAKMATMATTSLLGRSTAGTGNVEVISIGSGLTLTGGVLASSASGGTITALTGDVTASGSGSVVATIANDAVTTVKILNANVTTAKIANLAVTTGLIAANAVTYAKIQTQADQTLLGNVSGGTAVPAALVGSQVEALLFGSLASGILSVTATTGVVSSTALTNTEVMYATGANSIGQSANFTFASNVLSVPTVHAVGSGSLTLASSAVSIVLNNGPATAQLSGGFEIQGVTGAGSVGEALLFSKTGDQGITKSGGALYVGTIGAHEVNVLANNTLVAFWNTAGSLVPGTDDTYDLGTSSASWGVCYATVVNGKAHSLGLISDANINIAPQTGGNISLDAHVGSGNISLVAGGNITIGTTNIVSNAGGVGFLGAAVAGPQTGGAATAGAVYGATEQTMLQKIYNMGRTFGFLN